MFNKGTWCKSKTVPATVISDEPKHATGKLGRFRISITKVNLFQMR